MENICSRKLEERKCWNIPLLLELANAGGDSGQLTQLECIASPIDRKFGVHVDELHI